MLSIKLVGVGGIGTALLSFLPRYLTYQQEQEVEFTLVDGDAFESRNVERQTFSTPGNKAEVKAAELREEFPRLTVFSQPVFVSTKNVSQLIEGGDIVLLAVDNHATRLLVSKRCKQLWNVVLISAGNDLATGSCQVYIRRNRQHLTNPIDRWHQEIRFPTDQNPGDDPSCLVQAAQGEPQLVITNMAAALAMAMALYQFLEGNVPSEETYFDVRTGAFRPTERKVVHARTTA
ncbi:MAG: ThiF family adenylyltransferase [bacterium]|jgi:molybdopterin/thiamine biosynthesis adenylyltransferase|nr:ThiF family adenylyltransferase [bacterium]